MTLESGHSLAESDPTRRPTPAVWIWLGLTLLCFLLFLIDLWQVESGATAPGDRSLELSVHRLFGHGTFGLFDSLSTAGSTVARFVTVSVIALALQTRRRRQAALVLVSAVVGGELLNALVKTVVARPRPHLFSQAETAGGYAFPSGHAMSAIIFFGALTSVVWMLTMRRDFTIVAALAGTVASALIGLARIVLGVHYPTDVLGGFELGLAWLFLVLATSSTWVARHRSLAVPPG